MINQLKNISLLMVAGMIGFGMTGCSTGSEQPKEVIQVTIPTDDAQRQKLYNYLLGEQGIDIIKVGETRTIVISSDELFIPGSANFQAKYADNLKIVAQLINSYDTTNVAVDAYSDQNSDPAQALTEKQAQKVLTYLKKYGVDTRLIYAKGYGNLYPVSINKKDNYFNRRVEIKFQFHKEEGIH